MAVKTLAEIKADLRRIKSKTADVKKQDRAPDVSLYTILRDLVDSLDSIIAAS